MKKLTKRQALVQDAVQDSDATLNVKLEPLAPYEASQQPGFNAALEDEMIANLAAMLETGSAAT